MQFVNAFRCLARISKKKTTEVVTNFYSREVDEDIFIELDKLIRANHPGRINQDYSIEEVKRYYSQLANFQAKYYAITSGVVLGLVVDPKLYELPENARDFWIADWERHSDDEFSLQVDDASTELGRIGKLLESWCFPSALAGEIMNLFSVKRVSGEGNAPYIGFVPSRVDAMDLLGDADDPADGIRWFGPRGAKGRRNHGEYSWIQGGDRKDHDDTMFLPPTAVSLRRELTAFRNNPMNTVIHSVLMKSLKMPTLSIGKPSTTANADWFALWQNGGVLHEPGILVPNAGAPDFDGRYALPIWGSGSVTDSFITWYTHGFGPTWLNVAGRALLNQWGAYPVIGDISDTDRLPVVVYYDHDVGNNAVRNELTGKVDNSAAARLSTVPLDRFKLGWRHIIHEGDSLLRSSYEVGMMPANKIDGKLYWVDTSAMRKEAWFKWRSLLGVS